MALSADEKEQLMSARTSEKEISGTIVYTVIVSGQTFPMISVMGQSEKEAYEYCSSIFGARFEGFKG